jgi:hypothetical protein
MSRSIDEMGGSWDYRKTGLPIPSLIEYLMSIACNHEQALPEPSSQGGYGRCGNRKSNRPRILNSWIASGQNPLAMTLRMGRADGLAR